MCSVWMCAFSIIIYWPQNWHWILPDKEPWIKHSSNGMKWQSNGKWNKEAICGHVNGLCCTLQVTYCTYHTAHTVPVAIVHRCCNRNCRHRRVPPMCVCGRKRKNKIAINKNIEIECVLCAVEWTTERTSRAGRTDKWFIFPFFSATTKIKKWFNSNVFNSF